MPRGYYAYIVGEDGHVQNRVEIRCDNDQEARRGAQQLVDDSDVELWQEARFIATFRAAE
jgi:hypothetical protein